jgi:hypothetical protein
VIYKSSQERRYPETGILYQSQPGHFTVLKMLQEMLASACTLPYVLHGPCAATE